MRSRYAAFARKQIDYLLSTSHPSLVEENGGSTAFRAALKRSCEQHQYPGLRVLEHHEDGDQGEVLFLARVFRKGVDLSFSERSLFFREQGKWLYHSGVIKEPLSLPL